MGWTNPKALPPSGFCPSKAHFQWPVALPFLWIGDWAFWAHHKKLNSLTLGQAFDKYCFSNKLGLGEIGAFSEPKCLDCISSAFMLISFHP